MRQVLIVNSSERYNSFLRILDLQERVVNSYNRTRYGKDRVIADTYRRQVVMANRLLDSILSDVVEVYGN